MRYWNRIDAFCDSLFNRDLHWGPRVFFPIWNKEEGCKRITGVPFLFSGGAWAVHLAFSFNLDAQVAYKAS